jgi:DNA-binding MarR family transcriptional regulator
MRSGFTEPGLVVLGEKDAVSRRFEATQTTIVASDYFVVLTMTEPSRSDERSTAVGSLLAGGGEFGILLDLLGHPTQLPSLAELDYVNPSKSRRTIRNHIDALEDAGVVGRYELPPDERSRDLPHTFFGLTPEGRELLAEHKLLRGETTQQQIYAQVEKTEKIRKYESAPRPSVPDVTEFDPDEVGVPLFDAEQ